MGISWLGSTKSRARDVPSWLVSPFLDAPFVTTTVLSLLALGALASYCDGILLWMIASIFACLALTLVRIDLVDEKVGAALGGVSSIMLIAAIFSSLNAESDRQIEAAGVYGSLINELLHPTAAISGDRLPDDAQLQIIVACAVSSRIPSEKVINDVLRLMTPNELAVLDVVSQMQSLSGSRECCQRRDPCRDAARRLNEQPSGLPGR